MTYSHHLKGGGVSLNNPNGQGPSTVTVSDSLVKNFDYDIIIRNVAGVTELTAQAHKFAKDIFDKRK